MARTASLLLAALCFLIAGKPIDAQTVLPYPAKVAFLKGQIQASVTQPDGKVIIGGSFSAINGSHHNNIARLNTDGSVDETFDVDCDAGVMALALADGTLYVGGQFTMVNGYYHRGLAAVNAMTAAVLDLDAQLAPNNYVQALAVSPSTLYVSGSFTSIAGTSRAHLAGLDRATWAATAWDPQLQPFTGPGDNIGFVVAMTVSGESVYVGGLFAGVGGKSFPNLARVSASSGIADDWNPDVNDLVGAIVVDGSNLYVGGLFTSAGGHLRSRLAQLSIDTGMATSWNPGADQSVSALMVTDDAVYAGGGFAVIGGQARREIAELDRSTGLATTWNPSVGPAATNTLALLGTRVLAGGGFSVVQNHNAGGLALFERADATVASPASAEMISGVEAIMTQSDGKVILGGDFTQIDGVDRNYIARLNADGSLDAFWNPNADARITSLAQSGNLIFAAGLFQHIGGKARNLLVTIDVDTGAVGSWNPAPDAAVRSMAILDGSLYVGGGFSNIGGESRATLAAFDTGTLALEPWNPGTDGYVLSIAAAGSTVYAGGQFDMAGGAERHNIAAIDALSGQATPWDPQVDSYPPSGYSFVWALLPVGDTVYAGGYFATVGGAYHSNLAAIDDATGLAGDWDPGTIGGPVYALASDDSYLYVGGAFWSLGGQVHSHLGAFDLDSGQIVGWNATPWPGNYEYVSVIGTTLGAVLAGGYFTRPAGTVHNALVAFEPADIVFHSGFDIAD